MTVLEDMQGHKLESIYLDHSRPNKNLWTFVSIVIFLDVDYQKDKIVVVLQYKLKCK